MGNQGYSNEGTRQVAEMIWAGEIGNVTEVHAWTDRPIWPQGVTEIPPADPLPSTLDWDLWLGIAEQRPFTLGGKGYPNNFSGHFYQPFNWRGFYDFGCGALGDMACHILGAPNLALQLGAPTSVECIKREGTSEFMFPKKSVIRFDFPARWLDAARRGVNRRTASSAGCSTTKSTRSCARIGTFVRQNRKGVCSSVTRACSRLERTESRRACYLSTR